MPELSGVKSQLEAGKVSYTFQQELIHKDRVCVL